MGLNVAKCTIPFQQRLYGWTETYYLNSPSSTLDAELAKLQVLTEKRIALSGQDTYVSYLKVSNESRLRDVKVKFFGGSGSGAYVGTSGKQSDVQNTALLCKRVGANNSKFAPLYMRGIWDEIVINGGQLYGLPPDWVPLWNSYRAVLLADGWGFLAKSDTTPVKQDLLAVLSQPDGRVALTTVANVFDASQIGKRARVFLAGITGAASLNGSQIVNVTALAACTTVNRIPIFDWTGGGSLSNNIGAFVLMEDIYRTRIVERKAGRPLYLSRGRQRARKLA